MSEQFTFVTMNALRGMYPRVCWNPDKEWENLCVRDLGHDGKCFVDQDEFIITTHERKKVR